MVHRRSEVYFKAYAIPPTPRAFRDNGCVINGLVFFCIVEALAALWWCVFGIGLHLRVWLRLGQPYSSWKTGYCASICSGITLLFSLAWSMNPLWRWIASRRGLLWECCSGDRSCPDIVLLWCWRRSLQWQGSLERSQWYPRSVKAGNISCLVINVNVWACGWKEHHSFRFQNPIIFTGRLSRVGILIV